MAVLLFSGETSGIHSGETQGRWFQCGLLSQPQPSSAQDPHPLDCN